MKTPHSDFVGITLLCAAVGVIAIASWQLGQRLLAGPPQPKGEATTEPSPLPASTTIELAPGVQLFIDPYNGCQYLVTRHGMAPRMHSDGVQVCKDAAVHAEGSDSLDRDFARLDHLRRMRF